MSHHKHTQADCGLQSWLLSPQPCVEEPLCPLVSRPMPFAYTAVASRTQVRKGKPLPTYNPHTTHIQPTYKVIGQAGYSDRNT